jgi:hypothetical protein
MKYASGTFHLHRDLTVGLEGLIETYTNASFIGKKIHKKLGLEYEWKLETYELQFPEDSLSTPAHKPLSYHDFVRGCSPPSSATIQALFSSVFY